MDTLPTLYPFDVVTKRTQRARKTLSGVRFAPSLEVAQAQAAAMAAEELCILVSVAPAAVDPRQVRS